MIELETRVGKAGWGDHRFRGHAVYAELLGKTSLSQLLALALDVELDSEAAAFFDELAVSSTLADPHIWPLKLTRVAGAYGGSAMTGLAAGLLATDGPLMGAGAVGPAAEWLQQLVQSKPLPAIVAEIRSVLDGGGRLPGFGVPARRVDERVTAIAGRVAARGRAQLPHWAVWLRIVEETRKRSLEPNLASAFAAAILDLGFPAKRAAAAMHLCLLACFLANASEGADQQPEVLQRIPNHNLQYCGPARRPSSRRASAS